MDRRPNKLIPADLKTTPGLDAVDTVDLRVGEIASDVEAIGVGVYTDGDVPGELGFDRAGLEDAGFTAEPGTSLVLPRAGQPDLVAVGLGDRADDGPRGLRDAAAALARAVPRRATLGLRIGDLAGVEAGEAVRALAEGALLARYRYTVLNASSKHVPLAAFTVDVPGADGGPLEVARTAARAGVVARDLANAPPGHLTAVNMGEIAVELGERFGFEVELFDKQALIDLGCGGLLGVNQGSVEEPRMIKLVYTPEGGGSGHLGLVGKGIMYDSGGISLKPSDPMHLLMKMDMGGAAAVLGAFVGLRDAGVSTKVSGWLMCTDNMPSGTAYKLGDVLTARGGTTIEVKNTDAEGRLVMSDALVLATEDGVDAIVDIATLTGAALVSSAPRPRRSSATTRRWSIGCARPRRSPTSPCGSCRSSRSIASNSTPTSPTSRTSVVPSPEPRRRRCSCSTSWARRRGRTSTSPGRCRPRRTTPGAPRVPPVSVRDCCWRRPGASRRPREPQPPRGITSACSAPSWYQTSSASRTTSAGCGVRERASSWTTRSHVAASSVLP